MSLSVSAFEGAVPLSMWPHPSSMLSLLRDAEGPECMGTALNIKYFSIFKVSTAGRAVGWPSDIREAVVFTRSTQTPEQSQHAGVLLPGAGSWGQEGEGSAWFWNL